MNGSLSAPAKFREACLTCPVFLTGPEFLPELREQHRRTLALIDVSNRQGQTRMVIWPSGLVGLLRADPLSCCLDLPSREMPDLG